MARCKIIHFNFADQSFSGTPQGQHEDGDGVVTMIDDSDR